MSALPLSTQLTNEYQMGKPCEGCLFSAATSPEKIAFKKFNAFSSSRSRGIPAKVEAAKTSSNSSSISNISSNINV